MKRKWILGVSSFFIFMIAVSYSNCGSVYFGGNKNLDTVSGNPFSATHATEDLLADICGVINRCNSGVTYEQCQSGILSDTINSQLGASSQYANFSALMQAEQTDNVSANSSAASQCEGSINALSCSDPSVQSAYNPANTSNPFANAGNMIPSQASSDCDVVFAAAPSGATLIWSFDTSNMSGSTVVDTSGNGFNGTAVSVTSVPGEVGQALGFNGSTSQVYSGISTPVGLNQPLTVTAWVNTTSAPPGVNRMYIAGATSAAGTGNGYFLYIDSSGFAGFEILNNNISSGVPAVLATSQAVNDGNWHFVAASIDTTSGVVSIYVDGNNLVSTTVNFVSISEDNPFTVGEQQDDQLSVPFNGSIDEVRVYSRVLTPTEVSVLAEQ